MRQCVSRPRVDGLATHQRIGYQAGMGIVGLILGLVMLLAQLVLPFTIGSQAKKAREGGAGRSASVALWLARGAMASSLVMLVIVPVMLVSAFDATSGADDPSTKTALLSQGISEATNCGALAALVAWALILLAAGALYRTLSLAEPSGPRG